MLWAFTKYSVRGSTGHSKDSPVRNHAETLTYTGRHLRQPRSGARTRSLGYLPGPVKPGLRGQERGCCPSPAGPGPIAHRPTAQPRPLLGAWLAPGLGTHPACSMGTDRVGISLPVSSGKDGTPQVLHDSTGFCAACPHETLGTVSNC